MKMIKLHAYLRGNLGDDLMIHILLTRYPNCTFWFDGITKESNTFLEYPNFINQTPIYLKYGRLNHILNILSFYKKEDFFIRSICKKMTSRCSASLLIGGSMFIENGNLSSSERIALEESRLPVLPRFVVGINFGPYYSNDYVSQFSKYFQRSQSVIFRDQYSYSLFQDLNCVNYAPDVVLNLRDADFQSNSTGNTVIISVINPLDRGWSKEICDNYDRFIIAFCKECIHRQQKPILMSFCSHEGDPVAISHILSLMEPDIRCNISTYEYIGNITEALSLLLQANFILATRFHAMILALRFSKPFFCISYNEKIAHVLQDLNSDAYCPIQLINNTSPAEILDRFTQPLEVNDYIQSASQQFEALDSFLLSQDS